MNATLAKIEKYFSGTSQYPLLVILSSDEYREALDVFADIPKIRVSDYCAGADKEPDTDKLVEDVKRVRGNHLLIGFGDYLANKGNAAKSLLMPYKDIVLQLNSHVAVLLASHMYPIIKEIISSDLRVKSRVIFPPNPPHLHEINTSALVYGIKAYLEACEKGEAIGNVKTARKIYTVAVINPDSAFEELKHKHPNEFSKLSCTMGTHDNWGNLLENINRLKKNPLQYLAAQNFASPEYIFLQYAKKNDYAAWLYFIWLKLQPKTQSYLYFVISRSDTLGSLLGVAKTAILDISVTDNRFNEFYDQRKLLLQNCTDADMADFIPKTYRHKRDMIAYLTDNTKVEKQQIIVSLGEGAKKDYLKVSYPALHSYLQDYQFVDDGLTEYFRAYKKCKVSNIIDEALAEMTLYNAKKRPYNSLPSRTSVFSGIKTDKTLLIFLDALGVEFLAYIMEVCAELKLRVRTTIARANLPTITSWNKEFYDDWQGNKESPIKRLDDLKHHPECGYDFYNSPYPIYLSEELEEVRATLERAKTKLSTGEYRKVVIASDHGASRLAVLSNDVQIDNNGCEPKSSGRYCQGEDLPEAENIAHEKDYAIVADYSRFAGSRAASVEVHGGATLEEILVPIIELTLVDSNVQVTFENSIIEIGYKIVPEIILIITPDCDDITAAVNGTIYTVEKLEKSRFKVVIFDLKKGTYVLDVFENKNKIASKEFTIKSKGFSERNIF